MPNHVEPSLPYVAFTSLYGELLVLERFNDGRVRCKCLEKNGLYEKGKEIIIFECDIQKEIHYEDMWLL